MLNALAAWQIFFFLSFFNDSLFVVPSYDIVTDYRSSGENFKIKETRWKRDGRREGKEADALYSRPSYCIMHNNPRAGALN